MVVLPGRPPPWLATLVLLAVAGTLAWSSYDRYRRGAHQASTDVSSQARRSSEAFRPTPAQWGMLTVEPVVELTFRASSLTEGKVAIDEDRSTPIFSPYSGRVTKLLAKPGDTVERGQPLFVVEATDMVQAENDFLAALAAVNKARSRLDLAQTVEKRLRELAQSKAMAPREWQQAQADLAAAQSDLRSADVALEATRNRLRILGKTDQEIAAFKETGKISPETPIHAPLAGIVVQRKVGPGQYVSNGATDPVFVIGDLSTVWLLAYVREAEAAKVRVGQSLTFSVLADPDRTYSATLAYVAAALDPSTRRLMVRATIENPDRALKPEMFANVVVFTEGGDVSLAVPSDAVVREGDSARVRVAREDRSIELRTIRTGLVDGRMVQVMQGLKPGEKVITGGSLFIDRAAGGT